MKLGATGSGTYAIAAGDRGLFNTRKSGWQATVSKIHKMDTISYNVRNVSSTEVDRSLLLFTNSSGRIRKDGTAGNTLNNGSTNWRDCSVNNNLDNRIIFGGGAHHSDGAPPLYAAGTITADTTNMENFLLLAKDKKFDRIHFRMKNTFTTHTTTGVKPRTGSSGSGPDVKIVAYYSAPQSAGSSTYVWKPLKIIDGTTIDNLEWSSLYKSGTLSFDMPDDWIQTTAASMYGGSEWSDLVDRQNDIYQIGAVWSASPFTSWDTGTKATTREWEENGSYTEMGIKGDDPYDDELAKYSDNYFYGWQLDLDVASCKPKYITQSAKSLSAGAGQIVVNSQAMHIKCDHPKGSALSTGGDQKPFVLTNVNEVSPLQNWEFEGYGILLAIVSDDGTITCDNIKCQNVWTYNNSHSKSVKIVDPHHVSLNDIAVAQSISFGRKTRVRKLESRLGLVDIEKMGAEGGSITFGGVDLGSDSAGFNLIKSYQQKATPVFLDVTHKNNEITRFFGVVTNMSEDHPTGLATPKWGVTMELNYILELDAAGLIISDGRIPLGGRSANEPKYSLHT
jgi:hypothetical protein